MATIVMTVRSIVLDYGRGGAASQDEGYISLLGVYTRRRYGIEYVAKTGNEIGFVRNIPYRNVQAGQSRPGGSTGRVRGAKLVSV